MNTSAPLMASASVPFTLSGLVALAMASLYLFMPSGRPSQMGPLESHMMTFLSPTAMSSLMIAVPAAPAPLVTTLMSSMFLPTILRALRRPASVTTAVPCWSS